MPTPLELSVATDALLLILLGLEWVGRRTDRKYALFLLGWVKPVKGKHSRMNRWLLKEMKRAVGKI